MKGREKWESLAKRGTGDSPYICIMSSQLVDIKRVLESIKPELAKKYFVSSLGLFGSVVRDDFGPTSDIDIIVDFSHPIGIEFVDLANLLEAKLKRPVDLVSRNGIKKKYYKVIEDEIIYLFAEN